MKRFLQVGSLSVMVLLLMNGCSSNRVTSSEADASLASAAEAGTDSVPAIADAKEAVAEAPVAEAPATPAASDPAVVPPSIPTSETASTSPTTPSEKPATPAAPAVSGDTESYTVASGDTLMKIAFEHYGDLSKWKDIYEMNKDHIANPTALSSGAVLKLDKPSPLTVDRNGEKYLIHEGDTLGTISGDVYGMKAKWKRLWENNRQLIKNPNRIFAGFNLYYTFTPQDKMEKDEALKNAVTNPLSSADSPNTNRAVASVPATPVTPANQAAPSN